EMAEWADRLMDSFHWRKDPDEAQPADLSLFDDLGGCFQAVAEALSLVRCTLDSPKILEPLLPLVAEAQSALRAAIARIPAPDDRDQVRVFEWLKAAAARHRVYIKRFMRAGDLAPPTRWPDLLARIEKLKDRHARTGRGSRHEPGFTRLRGGLERIRG